MFINHETFWQQEQHISGPESRVRTSSKLTNDSARSNWYNKLNFKLRSRNRSENEIKVFAYSIARLNDGNSTEWSEIWPERIRVVSKSNEREARVRFEMAKYDFRPKLHDPKFNCHFQLQYIHFEIAQFDSLYTRTSNRLSKSEIRNELTSHFDNMWTSCQRDVIASCDWLFCFTVFFLLAEKKILSRTKK